MEGARLDCPLCGVRVSDGPIPQPGTCPGCSARYDGGGETPRDAAVAFLGAIGIDGDADALSRALFAHDTAPRGVAITSDERDGFYAWWIFAADAPGLRQLIAELASGGS